MKAVFTAALCVLSGCLYAQCFRKVVSGNQYFIAISQDGSLWGWGENGNRQLGIGSMTDQDTPVLISSAQWKFAAPGTHNTLAIKMDGALWGWGADGYQQLGNGVSDDASFPLQIGTDNDWKEVVAGQRATLAIKYNGTLWGWGTNSNGFLGNGESGTYVSDVPVQIGTSTDWNHIAGSDGRHALAIKTDGTLWAWGRNHHGQLGNGSEVDQFTPVQIGTAADWKSVEAGSAISFAMKNNNTLWGWGFSSGIPVNVSQPMQIGTDANWQTFSLNKYDTFQYLLLVKTNGTLWAWGSDNYDQLGNGAAGNYGTPMQIGLASDWAEVCAGYRQGNAVKADGTFWAWGNTELVGNGSDNVDTPMPYACLPLAVRQHHLSVTLFPNPAKDWLNLSGMEVVAASAWDVSGRKYELASQGGRVDVSAMSAGIYILEVESADGIAYGRFIKQ